MSRSMARAYTRMEEYCVGRAWVRETSGIELWKIWCGPRLGARDLGHKHDERAFGLGVKLGRVRVGDAEHRAEVTRVAHLGTARSVSRDYCT